MEADVFPAPPLELVIRALFSGTLLSVPKDSIADKDGNMKGPPVVVSRTPISLSLSSAPLFQRIE